MKEHGGEQLGEVFHLRVVPELQPQIQRNGPELSAEKIKIFRALVWGLSNEDLVELIQHRVTCFYESVEVRLEEK